MMSEIEIRRMFIQDQDWERTSTSWKELKPLRNFNQPMESDESVRDCFERLKSKYDIPFEVIDQWIYGLYYNKNTVKNYGWIDYERSRFREVILTTKQVSQLNVVKEFRTYVLEKKQNTTFRDFSCLSQDIEHWKREGTWRIPPLVLDVDSFSEIPDYAEIVGPYQLIEGHSRFGYLLAMLRTGAQLKEKHKVFLLSQQR